MEEEEEEEEEGVGGDSAVTEAQTVEKKPSCVHDPDD